MSKYKLTQTDLRTLIKMAKESVGDNPHYDYKDHICYLAAERIEGPIYQ